MPDEPSAASEESPTPDGRRLAAATLYCENCGQETAHRVLRVDGRGATGSRRVAGVARCRDCRFTHPFVSTEPDRADVAVIVSAGATSHRSRVQLARARRLQVGGYLPDAPQPLEIRRLEDREGRSQSALTAAETATVWVAEDIGAVVPVSVIDGRVTRPARLRLAHGTVLGVGETIRLEEVTVEIVALRARGETWRRPGDRFSADEITRVYSRRTASPPAGNSPWSRVRARPSSRESSTSTAARARSSPGTSTTRRTPRARTADGGAQVQRRSPR
jgi:uncharacterized Zn finger protein